MNGPHCVRSIRLECQNKYFFVWASSSVNKSIICYENTLNGLVEKNVVEVCCIYKRPIVSYFITQPFVTNSEKSLNYCEGNLTAIISLN